MENIVKTFKLKGNFNNILKAIEVSGLLDSLCGPGPFTVFAPNDEAFSKVPKTTIDALLGNKALLTTVLKCHIIPGAIHSRDIKHVTECKPLEGDILKLRPESCLMVNHAKVVEKDILCENGVIHVIDTVLIPKSIQDLKAA